MDDYSDDDDDFQYADEEVGLCFYMSSPGINNWILLSACLQVSANEVEEKIIGQ